MTEEQATTCDTRWQEYRERGFIEGMAAGANAKYADVYMAREGLSHSKGTAVPYSDVLVPLYFAKMHKDAESMSWGLWRNDYHTVSQLYGFEQQFERQLETLLAVCYIDANGPNNTMATMQSAYPPFTPPRSLIGYAPGIILQINQLLTPLAMDEDTEKSLFLRSAESVRNEYMSITPEVAWNMVLEAQEDYDEDPAKP